MVDQNRVEGFTRDVGGKVQNTVGGLMGDTATQARGKASQAAGAAQNLYGQVVDEVRSFAFNQPVGALLLTMGLGVMLGFLLGRR